MTLPLFSNITMLKPTILSLFTSSSSSVNTAVLLRSPGMFFLTCRPLHFLLLTALFCRLHHVHCRDTSSFLPWYPFCPRSHSLSSHLSHSLLLYKQTSTSGLFVFLPRAQSGCIYVYTVLFCAVPLMPTAGTEAHCAGEVFSLTLFKGLTPQPPAALA